MIHSMHSLRDTQFWLCYLLFIVPVVKSDLKLCVNHQFVAPSLYNQITHLIFITDIFRPKIKIYVQCFLAARFVCARSVVFCQNFWQITERLPGNWRGSGNDFRVPSLPGLPLPLHVSFSRARFSCTHYFQAPATQAINFQVFFCLLYRFYLNYIFTNFNP